MKRYSLLLVVLCCIIVGELPLRSFAKKATSVEDDADDSRPTDNANRTIESNDEKNEIKAKNKIAKNGPSGDGNLLEINPHYVEPNDFSDDSATITDDDHDDDTNAKVSSRTKSVLDKSLGKNSTLSAVRKTARFLKRHRLAITVAAILFAFRREILDMLWKTVSQPMHDPETGKVLPQRRLSINPTSILKVVLFVHVMRRLQRNSGNGRGVVSPTTLLLLGRLTGNQGLALLLSGLIQPSNPAFIPPVSQHYTFERLNDRYTKDAQAYSQVVDDTKRSRRLLKKQRDGQGIDKNSTPDQSVGLSDLVTSFIKPETEISASYNSTIVVMDWTGLDTGVSRMSTLRDEVSFLIDCYEEKEQEVDEDDEDIDTSSTTNTSKSAHAFEVLILLESPGGSASDYALAAQQLLRLRRHGMNVTVCVDKVAASGGYMIACTSSPGRLFCAPFALLGSIGVVGQTINIHNVLQGWGVKPLVFRGGKDKAPVGLIGEVTKEGIEKVQHMVDDVHRAFKRHVADSRPCIASRIEEIATGDTWLGYDALNLGLVDRLVTSDEYIGERMRHGSRVLKLYKIVRTPGLFSQRISLSASIADQPAVEAEAAKPTSLVQSLLQPLIRPLLSELNAVLGRIHETLSTLLSPDDFSSLTRTMGVGVVRDMSHSTP